MRHRNFARVVLVMIMLWPILKIYGCGSKKDSNTTSKPTVTLKGAGV